jgi:hypothetical protein
MTSILQQFWWGGVVPTGSYSSNRELLWLWNFVTVAQRTQKTCLCVGDVGGGGLNNVYTHVSKCKNEKIKF